MRYTLKDYQADAVGDVLANFTKAKAFHRQFGDRSQFSLTASTGAGKTVMAAAVIEALFFGSDEFDFAPDPGAVVLWFSDDPSLNEQSRARIQSAASELDARLRVIPATFGETKFRPGHVYFLNTQKLSKKSRLVRGQGQRTEGQEALFVPRPDEVPSSIYDTITNTIEDPDLTLYLILDEAHRGMGTPARERTTIVQRLINGHGFVPAIPVVWGISATVERFEAAMKGAQGRTALPSVQVDSALVQASGLLKDDIVLGIPTEAGVYDTVLLKRAVRKAKASTQAWAAYATEQGHAEAVSPLMVVQVGDKPQEADLARVVDAVFEEWSDLPGDAVANVFGEHQDLTVANTHVPYISPERVQDATHVRVLLAKSAISTGWDCPRAEVLVSFRPAVDKTHITQLLGRMMRTPLAMRVPGNEVLNSVDCLLPFFDRRTATEVASMLMRGSTSKEDAEAETGSGGGEGRRVLFDPVEIRPNPALPQAVWDVFESIPTQTVPKKGAKPIKRLTALAHALAGDGMVDDAGKRAHAHLHAVLDGRAVQYQAKVRDAVDDVKTMEGEELRSRMHGRTGITATAFAEAADYRAIQDAYRSAGRAFSADLARTYVEHLAGPGGDDEDLRAAHVKIAALALVPQVAEDLEAEADKAAKTWFDQTRVARKALPHERQGLYDDLEAMSTTPQTITLAKPTLWQQDTRERDAQGNEHPLATRRDHLLCAQDGTFPVDLNEWERQVLNEEMARPGAVAWYRNPSRATKESLAIAYKDPGTAAYKAMRPDFMFFSTRHDGTIVADIVDPHGHHLADALPKLRGLAEFAEHHGHQYGRIEAVAKVGQDLRVLDLTKSYVRQAIHETKDARALYISDISTDY